MPIFMDRHDVSENVTAEIVAHIHQEDLKVQHKYGCRGLTYWFDDVRKTAFCLVDAPNKNAIIEMHKHAHGEVPHQIIEVDETIVESFLGRIEDPEKAKNTRLNIINDPAFRVLMVIKLQPNVTDIFELKKMNSFTQNYNTVISKLVEVNEGRIVEQTADGFLVSFKSVTKAVVCAREIYIKKKLNWDESEHSFVNVKIALNAGVPVTQKGAIFEDTIKLAERMINIETAEILVSWEVKELYKSENSNHFIEDEFVLALSSSEEKFINQLVDFTEMEFKNSNLLVDDFNRFLGYSKSQLYRKMISLVGKSPNAFLMSFRLNRAMEILRKNNCSISEIAFETGFNSPSYFTKCFQKKYKILPSDYLHSA